MYSVSLGAADFGLTLGQVATDAKSNEITAIPALLKRVAVQGAIVTIDARGTPTASASDIIAGGADFVLARKGNQATRDQAVVAPVAAQMPTDCADCGARRLVTTETSHGRNEPRIVIPLPAPQTRPGFGRWTGLKTMAVVLLLSLRDGQPTYAARYFISRLARGVNRLARAVRSHGSLEITDREDESRIREAQLRENCAWRNRGTRSLLKPHTDGHRLALQRRRCGWNCDVLLEVLNAQRTECALALGVSPIHGGVA